MTTHWFALFLFVFVIALPSEGMEQDSVIEYIDRSKFLCMFPDHKVENLDEQLRLMNKAFHNYKITRRQRIVHFFVQAGVETDNFTTFTERIDATRSCEKYDGGCRYIGRGPLQIRHKRNYRLLSNAMKIDFVSNPEALLRPDNFFTAPAAYWELRGLNKLADVGNLTTISETLLEGAPMQLKRRNMTLSWVELCLPDSVVISPQIPRCGFSYRTVPSDTLYIIAQRYGVYVSAIIENNNDVLDENYDAYDPLPVAIKLYIPKCW